MPATIVRQVVGPKTLKIAANAADSDDLDVGGGEYAMVFVPVGWSAADISFLASSLSNAYYPQNAVPGSPATGIQPDPAFSPVQDEDGTLLRIQKVTPGRWHLFPLKALRMKYLRLRSTLVGADTPTLQSEPQSLIVVVKS